MKFSALQHHLVDFYNRPDTRQRIRDMCMSIVLDGLNPNDVYEVTNGEVRRKYPGVTLKVQDEGGLEKWIIQKPRNNGTL